VPAAKLTDALARPTLKAEAVLDGIFAQAVVVVEADGDRLVYQSVWETIQPDFKIDLHFATVGGTGGIADTCGLYRTLSIPIAVIADLDVLVDSDRMSRVLSHVVDDPVARTELLRASAEVSEEVREMPPTLIPEQVVAEMTELSAHRIDWSKRDDVELRRRLSRLTNDIDRMRRLKRGGLGAYGGGLRDKMSSLLDALRRHGLFLVPVGELEQWLHGRGVGVSTSDKRAWANAAAQVVQSAGKQVGDVWEFVSDVGRFLAIGRSSHPADGQQAQVANLRSARDEARGLV
jgi:hypothetical protein